MKKEFVVMFLFMAFLLSGCATTSTSKAGADKKLKTYSGDLNGDGVKEIVESLDKFDTESVFVVTVKNQDKKKKTTETLDTITVPGKLRKLELVEISGDNKKQIALFFDDKNNVSNIMLLGFQNNKLSKMFEASSKYGINSEFYPAVPRIKIGKAPITGENSPNRVPEWESWVWTGDKFIKE